MLLLGLTGDIACGKSTVARILSQRGAAHIDADLLVRELYADLAFAQRVVAHLETSTERHLTVAERNSLLEMEAGLNRKALGDWVFNEPAALQALEQIVHPAVAALRDSKLKVLRALPAPPTVVVLEAVKLVESGQAEACQALWWVTARSEVQLQRLMMERGLSEEEARLRLQNQPSPAARRASLAKLKKRGVVVSIIKNNGTLFELEKSIGVMWQKLYSSQIHS